MLICWWVLFALRCLFCLRVFGCLFLLFMIMHYFDNSLVSSIFYLLDVLLLVRFMV